MKKQLENISLIKVLKFGWSCLFDYLCRRIITINNRNNMEKKDAKACDKKEAKHCENKDAKHCDKKDAKASCGGNCEKCTECKATCSKTNCKDCTHKGQCKKNCKK